MSRHSRGGASTFDAPAYRVEVVVDLRTALLLHRELLLRRGLQLTLSLVERRVCSRLRIADDIVELALLPFQRGSDPFPGSHQGEATTYRSRGQRSRDDAVGAQRRDLGVGPPRLSQH